LCIDMCVLVKRNNYFRTEWVNIRDGIRYINSKWIKSFKSLDEFRSHALQKLPWNFLRFMPNLTGWVVPKHPKNSNSGELQFVLVGDDDKVWGFWIVSIEIIEILKSEIERKKRGVFIEVIMWRWVKVKRENERDWTKH
jgi:hypothetical protein